ncbi:MAG: nucleotidyltransferase domain-containing protein [Magnetococcales bacterium]|nr:nucleotidyltransferase domain-containing protein [Magnetococcales bacterium]
MNETGMNPREMALMHTVFRHVPDISEVIVFGSRAKGNYRPHSDVDLALVGVADELLAEAVADALDMLPMPYQFDVKACDAIRYPPLLEHIRRVGVTIYRRDVHATPQAEDREQVVSDALWGLPSAGVGHSPTARQGQTARDGGA